MLSHTHVNMSEDKSSFFFFHSKLRDKATFFKVISKNKLLASSLLCRNFRNVAFILRNIVTVTQHALHDLLQFRASIRMGEESRFK